MEDSQQPAVVLLSGGLDSAVLLHYVVKTLGARPVFALSFEYGQKHSRELEMARWQAEQLRPIVAEHQVVELRPLAQLAAGATSLLRDGPPVPDLADVPAEQREQPSTYVPNRNMILLSLAAAFAESKACSHVYYGAQAHDAYGYWDCTADFVARVNGVLALNRRTPVQIRAPFADLRKAEEIRLGVELCVDLAHTWSCYRGGATPCETCPTCRERGRAFAEAGMCDPALAS